jgi:hypothetical protein
VQADAAVGTVNDFALTAGITELRCTNATLRTYTGWSAGAHGQEVRVIAAGAGQIDFANQAAASAAANRFLNNVTGTISIVPGGNAVFAYDTTTARWRVVAHNQGGPIAVPFTAGHFTASGGSWTLAVGDVSLHQYRLDAVNKRLSVDFDFTTTSVGAGTTYALSVLIAGGLYSASATQDKPGFYWSEDGTTFALGMITRASGTTLSFFKLNLVSWIVTVNLTIVRGSIDLFVA